jgi:LacI family transcriptional regulator
MNKHTGKRIGIKDIAARAGVSIGTVDRVLHMRGDVSEATKRRVLQIVEESGYTPNVIARTLSSRKALKIGIVIPDSSDYNPYWEIPVQGIRKAADELARYNTGIVYEFFDASDEASFRAAFRKVRSQDPDGVVVNPVFGKSAAEQLKLLNDSGIPSVFIDVDHEGIDKLGYFGQDARQSGRVAASLIEAGVPGLSEVLIIKQTSRKVFSRHIESRISGFLEYFRESGKEILPVTIETDLMKEGEPERSLEQAVKQYPGIKAVFVPNSRVFLFADFIERRALRGYFLTGYDSIAKNIAHLEKGTISFLICQKPEVQAYNAIMALFDHLLTGKRFNQTNYSPIDIINKENITYYINN